MSNEDKTDGGSKTQLNLYSKSKSASSDKIANNTESQPVIINFYSATSSQKSDKIVQTDTDLNKQSESEIQKYPAILPSTEIPTTEVNLEPAEEDTDVFVNTSCTLVTDDTTETGLMEHRKQTDKYGSVFTRAQTDLERKKLEAELKAAEEIAKIRQSVIEKRLAVELAALNEDSNLMHKFQKSQQSTSPDSAGPDDVPLRKQPVVESNMMQEMDNLDYPTRFVSSRTSPPASSRHTSPTISPKLSAIKTELISTVLSSIRSLSVIDQKLNLDKKFSGSAGIVNPSSTGPCGYRPSPEQRYDPRERQFPEQRYDPRVSQIPEQRYDLRVGPHLDQRYDHRDRPHSRKEDRGSLERHYRHGKPKLPDRRDLPYASVRYS